jgi:hypothetical protein
MTNQTLKSTIDMLASIYGGSQIKSSRSKLDLFADRIQQAGTEPTLLGFAEKLQGLMDTSPSYIYAATIAAYIKACGEPDAPSVYAWIRKYSKVAAMIANIRAVENRDEIVSGIEIDTVSTNSGTAQPRRPFEIGMNVQCLTPLAHGSDMKAGNATLFRRMNVLSTTGVVLSLPFYAGNAIRGILRDTLADHLLHSLGLTPSRSAPPVSQWFFHVLYAGGALAENAESTKALAARFGKAAGAIRTDGLREFRNLLPSVSLLGTALGNRVIGGRIQLGDLRPRCKEWGNGTVDAASLFEWTYLTRREDLESYDEHSGMIATTETLRAGTLLEGGIDVDSHCQPLELSALARGLLLIQQRGRLGAENRCDMGGVQIDYERLPSPDMYDDFVASKQGDIVQYLTDIGAINASGKSDSVGAEED